MGAYRQTYATSIAASTEDCFRVLVDFERYPEWSSPIRECHVLDRYPDGLARRVEFRLDMTIKTLRYVLEYEYEQPLGARWHLVEGDVAAVDGDYRFAADGASTRATCNQEIDVGFWVPGFLRSTFEAKALHDSVEEFRVAVERDLQA